MAEGIQAGSALKEVTPSRARLSLGGIDSVVEKENTPVKGGVQKQAGIVEKGGNGGTPLSCLKKRSVLGDVARTASPLARRRTKRRSIEKRRVSFAPADMLEQKRFFDKESHTIINGNEKETEEQHHVAEKKEEPEPEAPAPAPASEKTPRDTPDNWEERYSSPTQENVNPVSPINQLVLEHISNADRLSDGGLTSGVSPATSQDLSKSMDLINLGTPSSSVQEEPSLQPETSKGNVEEDTEVEQHEQTMDLGNTLDFAASEPVEGDITAAVPRLADLLDADEADENDDDDGTVGEQTTTAAAATPDATIKSFANTPESQANGEIPLRYRGIGAVLDVIKSNEESVAEPEQGEITMDVSNVTAQIPVTETFTMGYGDILKAGNHPQWGKAEEKEEEEEEASEGVKAEDSKDETAPASVDETENFTMGYGDVLAAGTHPQWGQQEKNDAVEDQAADVTLSGNETVAIGQALAGRKSWAVVPGEADTMEMDLTNEGKACMGDKTYNIVFGNEPTPGHTVFPTAADTPANGTPSGPIYMPDDGEEEVLQVDNLEENQENLLENNITEEMALCAGTVVNTQEIEEPKAASTNDATNDVSVSMDITIAGGPIAEATPAEATPASQGLHVQEVAASEATEFAEIIQQQEVEDKEPAGTLEEEETQVPADDASADWSSAGIMQLSFTDFCYEAGVSFLDHLRRNTSAAFIDLAPTATPETLEQSLQLMCLTAPEVAMYELACKQLQEMVTAGKRHISSAENSFVESNPPISKQLQTAKGEDLEAVRAKMSNLKRYSRLKTKQSWLAWRGRMERSHGGRLAEHLQLLHDDLMFVQGNLDMLHELSEIAKNAAQSAQEKFEMTNRRRREKIEQANKLREAKARMNELKQMHEKKRLEIDQYKTEVDAMEGKRLMQRNTEADLLEKIENLRVESSAETSSSTPAAYAEIANLKLSREVLQSADILELQTTLQGFNFVSEDKVSGVQSLVLGVGSVFMLSAAITPSRSVTLSVRFSNEARTLLHSSERILVRSLYRSSEVVNGSVIGTVELDSASQLPECVQGIVIRLQRIERFLKQISVCQSKVTSLTDVRMFDSNSQHLSLTFVNINSESKVNVSVKLCPERFAQHFDISEVEVVAGTKYPADIQAALASVPQGYGWLFRLCAMVDQILRQQ